MNWDKFDMDYSGYVIDVAYELGEGKSDEDLRDAMYDALDDFFRETAATAIASKFRNATGKPMVFFDDKFTDIWRLPNNFLLTIKMGIKSKSFSDLLLCMPL